MRHTSAPAKRGAHPTTARVPTSISAMTAAALPMAPGMLALAASRLEDNLKQLDGCLGRIENVANRHLGGIGEGQTDEPADRGSCGTVHRIVQLLNALDESMASLERAIERVEQL